MTLKTDINTGAITEALNNKVDLVPNIPQDAVDYVIDYYPKTEEEKSQANGNWYRIYKSGWIEQGGRFLGTADVNQIHNFEIPFTSTNYTVLMTSFDTNDSYALSACARPKDISSFYYVQTVNGNTYSEWVFWEAKGY